MLSLQERLTIDRLKEKSFPWNGNGKHDLFKYIFEKDTLERLKYLFRKGQINVLPIDFNDILNLVGNNDLEDEILEIIVKNLRMSSEYSIQQFISKLCDPYLVRIVPNVETIRYLLSLVKYDVMFLHPCIKMIGSPQKTKVLIDLFKKDILSLKKQYPYLVNEASVKNAEKNLIRLLSALVPESAKIIVENEKFREKILKIVEDEELQFAILKINPSLISFMENPTDRVKEEYDSYQTLGDIGL